MSIEMFLSVANFAIAVGGLVPVFFFKRRRKEVALTVVVAALLVTSGLAFHRLHQHEQLIGRVQVEILTTLSHDTLTFDQLYQELHYRPFPLVNEALFRAVEKRVVGHRVIEFQREGVMLVVRGYYVQSPDQLP